MLPSSSGTVEELLARIEEILPTTETFDIWVPQRLTYAGEPISLDAVMAVVLDQLLARGMFPDGFDQEANGRTYHYRREGEAKPQLASTRGIAASIFKSLRAIGIGRKPEPQVGQVWRYATRRGEGQSRVVVLRIDATRRRGTIVHIAINGVRLKRPNSSVITDLSHIPVSKAAFTRSVWSVESQLERLPEFDDGYRTWRAAFDAGKAGVFRLSIAKIVDAVEATLR